jgi:hypothetical protein
MAQEEARMLDEIDCDSFPPSKMLLVIDKGHVRVMVVEDIRTLQGIRLRRAGLTMAEERPRRPTAAPPVASLKRKKVKPSFQVHHRKKYPISPPLLQKPQRPHGKGEEEEDEDEEEEDEEDEVEEEEEEQEADFGDAAVLDELDSQTKAKGMRKAKKKKRKPEKTPRKVKSAVWACFQSPVQGGEVNRSEKGLVCRFCGDIVQTSGSSSNCVAHMNNKHKGSGTTF